MKQWSSLKAKLRTPQRLSVFGQMTLPAFEVKSQQDKATAVIRISAAVALSY
jgi:hypothetical protein